jgi:hypothetical protein
MKTLNLYIVAFIILFFTHIAAQQYEIAHSVFGSGGTVSSNNDYKLMGTLGQPLIAKTSNTDHIKHIGFWYVVNASTVVSIDNPFNLQLPNKYILMQNYPNPFNPVTHIRFGLPKTSLVRMELYNVLGQRVALLMEARKPAGYHTFDFNGSRLASGIYFYRIKAGDFVKAKKMVLMK